MSQGYIVPETKCRTVPDTHTYQHIHLNYIKFPPQNNPPGYTLLPSDGPRGLSGPIGPSIHVYISGPVGLEGSGLTTDGPTVFI